MQASLFGLQVTQKPVSRQRAPCGFVHHARLLQDARGRGDIADLPIRDSQIKGHNAPEEWVILRKIFERQATKIYRLWKVVANASEARTDGCDLSPYALIFQFERPA